MKNFLKIVAAGILLAGAWCGVAVAREAGTSFVLSDNVPAPKWDEGYGVGNARLGALTLGGLKVDLEWDGKNVFAVLTATRPGKFTILCNGCSRETDFDAAGTRKTLRFSR